MNMFIDGLTYFFHKGEYGSYIRSLVNNILDENRKDLILLKDSIFEDIKVNNIKIEELQISRGFDTLSQEFLHCTNNGFYINRKKQKKYIISLNSALPLVCPSILNNNFINRYEKAIDIMNHANYITVSSNTQKNILMKNNINIEKNIKVLYPNISDLFQTRKKKMSKIYIQSKFKIKDNYLIYIGEIHRRKNLEEVLYFFKILKENSKYNNDLLILSFFAIHNNEYEKKYEGELIELSKILGIYNHIIWIKNPNLTNQYHLLNAAKKFIDLSTFDDLNLSIIKAFLCDTEIICSNLNLYKELLAEYPKYFEFDDTIVHDFYETNLTPKENESFDFLRDKFRGNESSKILIKLYNILLNG
ncbi:MAG: glycosyltransferase [Paraclostridium sp.]|uniref:glycosyltransferase n=1 Tax=Paraclostridium sp. TaxID=2023273 RepID=UPI003F393533